MIKYSRITTFTHSFSSQVPTNKGYIHQFTKIKFPFLCEREKILLKIKDNCTYRYKKLFEKTHGNLFHRQTQESYNHKGPETEIDFLFPHSHYKIHRIHHDLLRKKRSIQTRDANQPLSPPPRGCHNPSFTESQKIHYLLRSVKKTKYNKTIGTWPSHYISIPQHSIPTKQTTTSQKINRALLSSLC